MFLQFQFNSFLDFIVKNPEVSTVVILLYLAWELRGPKGAFSTLKNDLDNLAMVVRALAKVHDDIDDNMVDMYVFGDGTEPSDFILDSTIKSDGGEEVNHEEQEIRQ